MNPSPVRVALFVAGFAVWAVFSIAHTANGQMPTGEAWDRAPYWEFGVPLLFVAQGMAAAASREKLLQLPLWTLAGHFLAILAVRRSAADFGLLPLALVFIGVPAYGALYAVSFTVRKLMSRLAR
jgi:hypothetical protein